MTEIEELKDAIERVNNLSDAQRRTIRTLTLGTSWNGSGPYTQTVTISGAKISKDTRVDLDAGQSTLSLMYENGVLSLFIVNNNGTLVAHAIGRKPTVPLPVQVSIFDTETI